MAEHVAARGAAGRFRVPAQAGLAIVIAALCILFEVRSSSFLSRFNLFVMGRSLAIDIVIGFSQMVVLAVGGMNLSVGAIGVCCVMFAGYLMQMVGLPPLVAFAGALALGTALGAVNGVVIVRTGVESFIVTLASANLYSGAMLVLTRAEPLNQLPGALRSIGSYRFLDLLSPSLATAFILALALRVFFSQTAAGKEILATGANAKAAALSGVPIDKAVVRSHALSGAIAAIAGLMVLIKVGAAMPAVGGEDWLLPSFLGPVLGGAALAGGFISVSGAALGAALVTIIRAGLLVLGIGNFWFQLFLGLFLLAAVLVQRYGDFEGAHAR